ncbi:uncharacterized protein [Parasteatoda tepidariorum]|uniref:uncharacterized protein isoform X2 n=1 Tax=Parasteatoda tepidariorum TaxID=114398 RepID=UPI0039BCED73
MDFYLIAMAFIFVSRAADAGILGHSGVVFHVDKHGHWGGHSSHYDYRFYPEKSLLGYLMDHHHMVDNHNMVDDHHIDDDPYSLIPDHGYHGTSDPYFYYAGDHHTYH